MAYLKTSVVFCFVIVFCFIRISSAESPQLLQGIKDFQEENYEEALDSFLEAYNLEPKNPLTSYYLGMAYKFMQNFKEAVKYLKIALTLDPKLVDLYYEIGDSLFQIGELKEADKYLSEAEKRNIKPANTAMMRGLVFMGLGKTKEAIRYLNKAKEIEKSIAQMVDYQIATLYMRDNYVTRAKEYFKAVVMADPKSDLAEIAKRYMDAIELKLKEKRISLSAGVTLMYDDNVLTKPAVEEAAAGVSGKSDKKSVYNFSVDYAPLIEGPLTLIAQYAFSQTMHFKLASFDVSSHTINLVPSYTDGNNVYNINLSVSDTYLDDKKYSLTYSINPTYMRLLNQAHAIQLTYKFSFKEYLQPPSSAHEDRDGKNSSAGIGYLYLFKEGNAFINVKYDFDYDDTQGRNWDYRGNKATVSVLYPIMKKLNINASAEYHIQQYLNTHTTGETDFEYNKRRKDQVYTYSTLLTYDIMAGLKATLQLVHTVDDSNIKALDYKRTTSSIGLTYRW
ncbi:MAG: tetratricopeptide repeat protein [Nitrospirota bacterium]